MIVVMATPRRVADGGLGTFSVRAILMECWTNSLITLLRRICGQIECLSGGSDEVFDVFQNFLFIDSQVIV